MIHIDHSSIFLLGRELPLYTLLPIIGMVVAAVLNAVLAKRRGLDSSFLFRLTLPVYFAFLLGQMMQEKLPQGMLLFFYPLGAFGIPFLFGVLGKFRKKDCGSMMDLGVLLVLVYAVFARLGCFFSGCCYGPVCENGLAVVYGPDTNCPLPGEALFPLQLVSALVLALNLTAAIGKYRKGKHILAEAVAAVSVYYLHLWTSPASGNAGLCLTMAVAALLAGGCLMIRDHRKGM